MSRKSIGITLMPGPEHGLAIINGNCLSNQDCVTMIKQWLKEGEEIDLVITCNEISYQTIKLKRV
jgi:hypothetical protein